MPLLAADLRTGFYPNCGFVDLMREAGVVDRPEAVAENHLGLPY